VTTSVNRIATTMEIGTSLERPSARLDPPTAVTIRISSVAYAVDDSASDANTGRAMSLGSRWCSCSVVAMGRPTSSFFSAEYTLRRYAPGR
jgi:hypothetical protein